MNLVLLHGWGSSPRIWDGLRDELPEFTLSTPNLCPPSADFSAWADAIAADLPEAALLLGWSLGAQLALHMAARHPGKVRGLFLIGASPCFVSQADWPYGLDAATVAAFRADFGKAPARSLRRFMALQVMGDATRPALTPVLEAALTEPTDAALDIGLQLLEQNDLRCHTLPAGLPLQLVHGQHDALMPLGAAQWLVQQHPGARLYTMADAGHAPLFSHPAMLAALIREFADGC